MAEQIPERIMTPMVPSLVKAIDDYRYQHRIPSRAEAIRRLIELGLKAAQKAAEEPVLKANRGIK
jgi:hypothetical protein